MTTPRSTRRTHQSGFTLLEMVISLALLLVLSGAILGGMGAMQKNYRRNEIRTMLNGQMRATLELMAQEVGQAGLPPSGMAGNTIYTASSTGASGAVAQVTPSVTGSTSAQTVAVTNPTVQTNQIVIADSGASSEMVTITNVTGGSSPTITAIFQKSHSAGFSLYPHGVYPQGITFKTTPPTTLAAGANAYSNTSLIAFGDITGAGKLSIVEYSCPIANPALTGGTAPSSGNLATLIDSNNYQWGPLLRTEYVYNDGSGTFTTSTPATLLSLVKVASSAAVADGCRFDYNIYNPNSSAAGCTNWWMVTSVNVTIVAESQTNDPQTNAPVSITKSFMNIQPRNILNAYNMYIYNNTATSTAANNCAEFLSIPTQVGTQIGTFTQ